MLSWISAHGFRSLDDFELDVRPGLNVLVGPNGGGKTNILALFSFISALAGDELGNAISASGGASKVFKKTSNASFGHEIKISVRGELRFDRSLYFPQAYEKRLRDQGIVGIKYQWRATIDSSLGYDEAYYSFQKLTVTVVTSTLFTEVSGDPHLELTSTSSNPRSIITEEKLFDYDLIASILNSVPKGSEYQSSLIEYEDEASSSLPIFLNIDNSFLIGRISRDLRGGSTFNFDPAVCKRPNDSAQPASLERNGDGLAATIYAIQKPVNGWGRGAYYLKPRYDERTSATLQDYFQLINPAIHGVVADNNPIDNRIVINISVAGGSGDVDFPLELASDGTVKWLAFTVALLTEDNGFAIEEPENFLHPEIQRHAVELVRAETEGSENLFVLMTTHSESLLNASRPDELIIVSMDNGVTSAKRLDQAKLIDEEIYKTGFGLGYFYISGALSD